MSAWSKVDCDSTSTLLYGANNFNFPFSPKILQREIFFSSSFTLRIPGPFFLRPTVKALLNMLRGVGGGVISIKTITITDHDRARNWSCNDHHYTNETSFLPLFTDTSGNERPTFYINWLTSKRRA